jgi:hypothetical protein
VQRRAVVFPEFVRVFAGFERELADGVKFLRSEKQPVFMQDVIDAVEATIEGTEYADHFPNGVTTGWYYGWLERQGLRTGHMQPIEITRQKWLTSGNLKRYYEVLAAMLVKAGIARWNPDFDEDVPYSEVVLFIHPQRLTSHDETDTSLNADFSSKKNSNRGILDGRSDDGAVLGHKAGMKISATMGRRRRRTSASPAGRGGSRGGPWVRPTLTACGTPRSSRTSPKTCTACRCRPSTATTPLAP